MLPRQANGGEFANFIVPSRGYFSLLLVVSFSSFQHQHAPHIKISIQFVPVLVRVDASSLIRPVLSHIRVSNPLLLNFVFGVVINLNFLFISPFLAGLLC